MKQIRQAKSQYYFHHSHRDLKQNNSIDKTKNELYFSNDLIDMISTTDRHNLSNQENVINNYEINNQDKRDQNLQNQILGRQSFTNSETPRTMNYVNLSYQKIKSLNTASPINQVNSIDSHRSSKDIKKLSENNFDESQVRLSFIINYDFYQQSPSSSRKNTISSNGQSEVDQKIEKSNQHHKVSLYQIQYDQTPININDQIQQQEQRKINENLQLQLSPIIRRITKSSISTNKSPTHESIHLSENTQNKQNFENAMRIYQVNQQKNNNTRDQKSIKNELLRKVKMQTEHAFHFSSGRARLKNKRQMFSPCQSARYDCKVQFENKYLIKTSFIQPNDSNRDVQMVQVDLISDRRQKLFAKLEDIQNKKNKLIEQNKAEKQEQLDQEIEKQYELLLKKKDLNQLESPQKRKIENIKEIENSEVDDTTSKFGQQTEQSSFSDQISQIKMIENYNTMMKGIKNQINDLDQIVQREHQLQQKINYQNTSQSQSLIYKDKSHLMQNSVQQLSPFANNYNLQTKNLYEIAKSSSHIINTSHQSNNFTSQIHTLQSERKRLKVKDPLCNSNEILNRHIKSNQKSTYSQFSKDQNKNDFSLTIDIPTPKSKFQKLFSAKTIKSNKDIIDSANLNIHPPTSFQIQKEKPNSLEKSHTLDQMNNSQNILQQNKYTKQNSLEQYLIKKQAFNYNISDSNSEQKLKHLQNHFSNFNKSEEKIQSDFKISNQNEKEKQISNISFDQYIEDQEKQLTDENKTNPLIEINNLPKSNQITQPSTQRELQNPKKQAVDKNFLSALLTSWQQQKRDAKKPISEAFTRRRVILQRNVPVIVKRRKINYTKIKKQLLEFLKKLKRSQLSLDEFLEKKSEIFLETPMWRLGSFVFFQAIKHNNIVGVKTTVSQCRYTVFDFDTNISIYFSYLQKKQTCAHKAAKKGYTEMLEYFISQGADINALDIAKRKPLYYALKYNHYECVKLLLINMADPWSCENTDYYKMSAANPSTQDILRQFRKMHLVLMFTPYRFRKTVISNTIPQAIQH